MVPSVPHPLLSAVRTRFAKLKQTAFQSFGVITAVLAVLIAAAFYIHARQRGIAESRAEDAARAARGKSSAAATIAAAEAAAEERHAEDRENAPVPATSRPAQPATPVSNASPPAAKRTSDASLVALAAAEAKHDDSPSTDATPAEKPKGKAGGQPTLVDAQKQGMYQQSVAAARAAMRRRDLAGAKQDIRAAVKLVQTPEEEVEIARLVALAKHLDEFWKTISRVVASLTPAQEVAVGKTVAVVVETSAAQITFRLEGREQTYVIRDLPGPMVEALVHNGFADNVATKVLLGTYLAMDARGDRQAARKVWQEVINAGQDIKDLMAELDVASPGKMPGKAASGKNGGVKSEGAKADLPTDRAVIQQAEQAVRAKFEVDYNLASGIPGKLKLSEKLVAAAGGADVPAENRFVMFRDARDYALAAGKPETACDVIEQMARFFNVDPLEMKAAAMEQAAKMARTSASNREVAEYALGLVDQAIQAGRWDAAGRLAAVAVSTAQKTRNAAMIRSAKDAKIKVDDAAGKAGGSGQGKKEQQ